MSKDIKEILRIAKKNHYIDISFDECDLLLKYITNLEKENKQLKELTKDKSYCDSCEFKKYFNEKQQEIEKLENDKRGMLVQLYKANQRSEYLQRSCERKEEQMLDYRQEYMEQEDYKARCNKALQFIQSFEYYIPEDDKTELINILKGGDEDGM